MVEMGKRVLDSGWLAARSTEVAATGVQLTTTQPPSGPSAPWMEAAVPGTVLGTLTKNKLVPDPFYGLNNEAILDIADSGREYYTFWFFTTFECAMTGNQHVNLNFRAINYSAEVYLNGHKEILPKGMFRRHSLDVTDILHPDGKNLLAVLVYPPDHPGSIPPDGGQGGDHEIGKDVAAQYVEGWDWMTPIRDRNTGIWDEVSISITGPVKISDPHLVSSFFDNFKRTYLHTTVELENKSSWLAQCSLTLQVATELEGNFSLVEHLQTYELSIPSKTSLQYTFPPVWQEFWITGDCDGRGDPVSNPNGPLDHDLFMLCARDTVKLLRNHASLALWVGGNEQVPPKDINAALKNDLKLHPFFMSVVGSTALQEDLPQVSDDPSKYLDGTRAYVQGSMWDGFANGKGDFTDGPYEIQNPEDFFKHDFYMYGFNPEVGSVGMPVAATIRATMPPEGWQIPLFKKQSDGYIEEIPNPIWEYHKYISYSKPGKVHDQIELYGQPRDLDDFCEKAQLVNYIQYRALIEGWTSQMWTKFTGFLIWKTQNPWTGLRGQFYDHLHDQTAGFYGCRCAAEPVHVQLNLATYFIEVVNTMSDELSNIAIEVSVWDLEGTCPYYKVTEKIEVPPKTTLPIIEMKYPKSKNAKPVYFLLLKLFRLSNTAILSRNFYWLRLPGNDYKLLEPYRTKKVPLKITSEVLIMGSSYKAQMHVQNISKNSNSRSITWKRVENKKDDNDFDINSVELAEQVVPEKQEGGGGLLSKICKSFCHPTSPNMVKINGTDSGVAFFLHFSVHAAKKDQKDWEDTRILPVHYSDNYFSLVPGEAMTVDISFEVPQGISPSITLSGWNYHKNHKVF
ncbi:mannosylglycoprotein endo-beta-mannosidase isoform X2 [Elaeis guineensis]|uniref:Mannosylglycoprotein endo-beta-mannosidase isoform X3 n=1 Tax=Elaeis guineensis var. tenera TaxID=51953 RepID=A0A6I9S7L4_ELAGV|nr:mannosylglycoprotein endo-beta-mannosidase isoform X3 [Elaeis guineensis]